MTQLARSLRRCGDGMRGIMFVKGEGERLASEELEVIVHGQNLGLVMEMFQGARRMRPRNYPQTLVLHTLNFQNMGRL